MTGPIELSRGAVGPPPAPLPHARALRAAPELREMALVGGLAFFLHLFVGGVLQLLHMRWGLVATQILFISAPAIAALRWFYLRPVEALALRRPPLEGLAAAAFGTAGLNHLLTLAGAWQDTIFPMPDDLRRFFEDLFVYRGAADFALVLMVFAVIPALCEELLFRGFLQSGLVRLLGAPRGIAAGAVVFALFHLDPWRFGAVLVLGAFLGVLVHATGSLAPAVLAHALNNALSISFDAAGDQAARWMMQPAAASAACLLVALAALLLARAGRRRAETSSGRML